MDRKKQSAPAMVGGSSLLTVFAVLCLTVLALLSLSTARSQKRLADAAADSVTAYYAADCRAEEILARLRAGEEVPGVEQAENRYCFRCPISQSQTLEVEAAREQDGWKVLRWQVTAEQPQAEQTLSVWDGKDEIP